MTTLQQPTCMYCGHVRHLHMKHECDFKNAPPTQGGVGRMPLHAVVETESWSGHGEGGTIVKVVIRGSDYGLYESTPKQIEQAKRDAEIVNAALRAAKDT